MTERHQEQTILRHTGMQWHGHGCIPFAPLLGQSCAHGLQVWLMVYTWLASPLVVDGVMVRAFEAPTIGVYPCFVNSLKAWIASRLV